MRKAISLLLALSMVFALCACGAESIDDKYADEVVVEEAYFEYAPNINKYKLYVKAKNQYVNTGNKALPDRFSAIFQLLDKDGNIIVDKSNAADRVWFFNLEIGQSGWSESHSTYDVDYVESAAYIRFPAYSIMYHPDRIGWSHEGKLTDMPTFPVNIDAAESTEEQDIVCALGDTAITNNVELTLTDISFQEKIKTSSNGYIGTEEAIFCCLSIEVKNVGKEEIKVKDCLDVSVDYDNGYTYSTTGKKYSFLFKADDLQSFVAFRYGGSYTGSSMVLLPLASQKYLLAIPCTSDLMNDSTSPLKVVFKLLDANARQTFTYVVR